MSTAAEAGPLVCPHCRARTSGRVLETRDVDDQQKIRRRRRCEQCGRAYPTKEVVDEDALRRARRYP
jgi:transcriptional regulator NrdR family protein